MADVPLDIFLTELSRLLAQLGVTFFGVYLAFWMDKRNERNKDEQKRQNLLKDLQFELETIIDNLGKGNLHFPDLWDSAISSGQIRLLESEQVRKLSSVYHDVKGAEYEAKWVRQAKEDHDTADTRLKQKLYNRWHKYSYIQIDREKKSLEKIRELLQEKWWNKA